MSVWQSRHFYEVFMVLTKSELVAALQKEIRILLHLASKMDPTMLDYRPTPKQRSTIELLRYLSMMGTAILQMAASKDGKFDGAAWGAAEQAAAARDFDQTLAVIAKEPDAYIQILNGMSDADLRSEITGFDGNVTTRGAFIVSIVLGGFAAYRTQLFLYLKACGREELGTSNLWRGADMPVAV